MISVVCVFNNRRLLQDCLIKSLRKQTAQFQLILLDNTESTFHSAAEALNYGAKQAIGEYIMFVHQDVDLCSSSWLEKCEEILDELSNLGVAGVAGKRDGNEGVLSIVRHGVPPSPAWDTYITGIERVQTLDECLIIVPKQIFRLLKFDETTCEGWHLYSVDYCLSVLQMGLDVFVIPMSLHHLSSGVKAKDRIQSISDLGPLPSSYYSSLKKLLRKHRGHHERIYTTCGDWRPSYPLYVQNILRLLKGYVRLAVHKIAKFIDEGTVGSDVREYPIDSCSGRPI